MKEFLFPRGYKPETALQPEGSNLAWENPDSDLFVDWYLRQTSLSPEEQTPEFKVFLDTVKVGAARLPTDEQIARYKVRLLREKPMEE